MTLSKKKKKFGRPVLLCVYNNIINSYAKHAIISTLEKCIFFKKNDAFDLMYGL